MMKIVITNNSIMYNRGSEAVIRGVTSICRFWHPEATIVVSTGCYGEVIKELADADMVRPKYDANGSIDSLLNVVRDADIVLVTGADNYDYGLDNQHMIRVNDDIFGCSKAKTILYDCSLSPEHFTDVEREDMNRFSVITAREKRTEKVLKKHLGKKVKYYPDPAFLLPTEKCDLPFGFEENNTVGINISNLIMGKRVGAPEEIVIPNYKKVIDYLLRESSYKILIIQHVLNNGFDLDAAGKLYSEYEKEPRVSVMQSELLNAMNIKYIISKLDLLLTARTHASIAAYSTAVPTLVLGYSIKSIGIAEDIFGVSDPYVIPVKNLNNECALLDRFKIILKNKDRIKGHLVRTMPEYKIRALKFGEEISMDE